jgi:hypothetical protein
MWCYMTIDVIRPTPYRFGTLCLVVLAALSTLGLPAQQFRYASSDWCGGNQDCASYMGDFDHLLHQDNQLAAAQGKRPENRSHMLMEADSYLQQRLNDRATASHFRYLSCVSDALWSERGESRTLFSAENIIETYFALAGKAGDNSNGIERACQLLGLYQSRFEQSRVERTILQRSGAGLDPEDVWHSILLASVRKQTPKQNAAATVRRDQERYCLFAAQCRTAENSPFAGR